VRALVVGYGSIGARHARILRTLGCDVAVVSRRAVEYDHVYQSIETALASHEPEYVIVATETSQHAASIASVASAGFSGALLVEKPLFASPRRFPENRFASAHVAYNLRFHPLLQRVRQEVDGRRALLVQAYVGQHLSTWRPGVDYRDGYSADRARGGGVLRDLSHELDYVCWLFGGWKTLTARGGHWSSLELDSDDTFAIMLELERAAAVTVNMNYLDRPGRRQLTVVGDEFTINADFGSGVVDVSGSKIAIPAERDDSYVSMHQRILSGDISELCTVDEALDILQLVAAAESAAISQRWITR